MVTPMVPSFSGTALQTTLHKNRKMIIAQSLDKNSNIWLVKFLTLIGVILNAQFQLSSLQTEGGILGD